MRSSGRPISFVPDISRFVVSRYTVTLSLLGSRASHFLVVSHSQAQWIASFLK